MKVKEIMTTSSLQFCSPETQLPKAARIMKEANCGALPVVDEDNKVLGIITDRDICLSLAKRQTKPSSKITVGSIMSTNIYTINHNDDVASAFRQMRTNQIGRLPVIDEKGKLKGIVSLHSLINRSIGDGRGDLGDISSPDENLLKTIRAVTNRYNNNLSKGKKVFNSKKSKVEELYEEEC